MIEDADLDLFYRTPSSWKQAHNDKRQAKIQQVTAEPAERIVSALLDLPLHVAPRVWASLATSSSHTLSTIGEAILSDDPVTELTRSLWFDVFLFDLQAIAPKLSQTREPWATIRLALEDVDLAWNTTTDHRSAYDRRQLLRARGS